MNTGKEQKIRKKSNKKLYNIFAQNKNRIYRNIAEDELKKRNFDFENPEINKKEWEYIELLKESIRKSKNHSNNYAYFTLKFYLILILIFCSLISLLFFELPWEDVLTFILFMIGFISVPFFISRITYKIKRKTERKRYYKMSKLKSELKENKNWNKINERISKEVEKTRKQEKNISIIIIILFSLIILIMIIKVIFF